ncbi:Melibiase [compost metagenome]
MSGNFGYELDLTTFTEADKESVKGQIELYKQLRPLIQFDEFYRLINPFEQASAAWMFVSEDKKEALVAFFQVLSEPNAPLRKLRLKGLAPESNYLLYDAGNQDERVEIFGGDELMHVGLHLPIWKGDFRSRLYRLIMEE